jgi:hypothetical protein
MTTARSLETPAFCPGPLFSARRRIGAKKFARDVENGLAAPS